MIALFFTPEIQLNGLSKSSLLFGQGVTNKQLIKSALIVFIICFRGYLFVSSCALFSHHHWVLKVRIRPNMFTLDCDPYKAQ